jgi:hypothetical protein
MKNLYLLPSEKPSRLVKIKDVFFITTSTEIPGGVFYNVYITVGEQGFKGDYVIHTPTPKLQKVIEHVRRVDFDKVVITTDDVLIKDGVQDLDEEFLNWLVANPTCESVEINHFGTCCGNQLANQCIDCKNYKPIYKIVEQERQEYFAIKGRHMEDFEKALYEVHTNRKELPKVGKSIESPGIGETIFNIELDAEFNPQKDILPAPVVRVKLEDVHDSVFALMDKYADDVMGGCTLRAKEWFEQQSKNK